MLETLHIRNLALVEEADLDFVPGLNVVTGETGAGKSLVLGAVQLLLGERAGPSVIRKGAPQCELAASLRLPTTYPQLLPALNQVLESAGVPACEDGQLLLRRVVTPNGNRVFVNAVPTPLSVLRDLGERLVDIHGPHEHQSLLQPRCQLELLDAFAGLSHEVGSCAEAYRQLEECRQQIQAQQVSEATAAELSRLRQLVTEVDSARVQPGEEEAIEERYAVAEHASRLQWLAGQCQQALSEGDGSVGDQLGRVISPLRELADLDPTRGGPFVTRLEEAATQVQELSVDLGDYAQGLDFDEAELNRMRERRGLLQNLKRKHRCATLGELLELVAAAKAQLAAADGRAERTARLEADAARLDAEFATRCRALHAAREQGTERLAAAVSEKLQRLAFLRSTFAVQLSAAPASSVGADRVEFCFAPNPGEDVLPLRRIASSGEMARVMLATKTVLCAADQVPVLIFDEVDANIGGLVAVRVAEELAAIGQRHQVLCVTHLAQIAAAAQRHFQVRKETDGARTLTLTTALADRERLVEIARMLGAEGDSKVALAHARELLANADLPAGRKRSQGDRTAAPGGLETGANRAGTMTLGVDGRRTV